MAPLSIPYTQVAKIAKSLEEIPNKKSNKNAEEVRSIMERSGSEEPPRSAVDTAEEVVDRLSRKQATVYWALQNIENVIVTCSKCEVHYLAACHCSSSAAIAGMCHNISGCTQG